MRKCKLYVQISDAIYITQGVHELKIHSGSNEYTFYINTESIGSTFIYTYMIDIDIEYHINFEK